MADRSLWRDTHDAHDRQVSAVERYYLANKDGIDSWNSYVAEHGLPLAEYSDF